MGLPIGTVTVETLGTPIRVVDSGNSVTAVNFKARENNAGVVYVGGSDVSADRGYQLRPGENVSLTFREAIELSRFHVDAENANDRVDYMGAST